MTRFPLSPPSRPERPLLVAALTALAVLLLAGAAAAESPLQEAPVPFAARPGAADTTLDTSLDALPASGAALPEGVAWAGPQGIAPGPRTGGRPLRLYRNDMVDSLVRYFLEQKRDVLERGWRRSGRYLPMIRRVFRAEGVPEELAYLAAVESNFNPRARSPARAVGLWQFTAPTARAFGLRMHRPWYDERLDPESATHAAARLLAYLYDRYESWELALAAYNAGEARVNRALAHARRTGRAPDYWHLRLPRQTRGFVPAFLALAAIMEDPAAHGLAGIARDAPLESEGLELDVAATLADLAGRVGVPTEALVRRNPAWQGGLIPPVEGVDSVLLWVPPGLGPRLLASLQARPPDAIPWLVHRVREGETVSHIAQYYGVRIRDVLALNSLHWRSTLAIGQPLLVPVAADTPVAAAAEEPLFEPEAATAPAVAQLHLHRVRSGESLWSIARTYGVRMTQLKLWNRLAGQVLQPNQELVVFLPTSWTTAR